MPSPASLPRILMVDVDGVVITPRSGGWAADLERDHGLAVATLQQHFFAPHWTDVVLGRATLRERLTPVLADHAPHLPCDTLIAYWFANDAQLNEPLLADLAALRAQGVPLHLATVQEHERARHLWDGLGFRDRFDAMHYAADLGAKKPDADFFAAVQARVAVEPGDLMLLDDAAANVEAARAAGWRASLWDGTATLAEVLTRPA